MDGEKKRKKRNRLCLSFFPREFSLSLSLSRRRLRLRRFLHSRSGGGGRAEPTSSSRRCPPAPPGGEKTLGCAAARGGGGLSEGGSPQSTRLKPRVTRTKKKITLKMGGRGETFPFLFSTRAPLPSRLLLPRFLPPLFFPVGDGGKILPLLSQLAGEEFLSWFSYHFQGRREELASTIGPALIRPHSSPVPWPISACRRRLNRWDMTTQYSEDVKWRECESLARACLLEFPAFWPRKMQRFSSFL